MALESGAHEPLIGYIVLGQTGITVDVARHRLTAVKQYLDLTMSNSYDEDEYRKVKSKNKS